MKLIWRVLLFVSYGVAALLCCAIIISKFSFDNRFRLWWAQNDTNISVYEDNLQIFGNWDWILAELEAKDSIYIPEFLNELEGTVSKLEAIKDVHQVIAITNIETLEPIKDGLDYQRILPATPLGVDAAAVFRNKLQQDGLYDGILFQEADEKSTVVLLRIKNLATNQEDFRSDIVKRIEQSLSSTQFIHNYTLLGTAIINTRMTAGTKSDLLRFYPLLLVIIIFFSYVATRRISDTIIIIMVMAVLPAVGLAFINGHSVNTITAVLPSLIMTISVAGQVHLLGEFHSHWSIGNCAKKAVTGAVKEIIVPSFFAMITTVIGFLALSLIQIYPIKVLAVYSALGSFLAWLLLVTLAPILLIAFYGMHKKTLDFSLPAGIRLDGMLDNIVKLVLTPPTNNSHYNIAGYNFRLYWYL